MLDHLCLCSEGLKAFGTSVQPPQFHVKARHVDRQLFLNCGVEATVLADVLGLLLIFGFGWLRSIVVVNVRKTKQFYLRDFLNFSNVTHRRNLRSILK